MTPSTILITIACYFLVLMLISWRTGRDDSNAVFLWAQKPLLGTLLPLG